MIRRILDWRKTETGIWSEWFACAAVSIALPVISAAVGWHWAITSLLASIAAIVCGLIVLMWSIRNDLGEYDRIDAMHHHNDEAMKPSTRAMAGPDDEGGA